MFFSLELSDECLVVRDHFHIKNFEWPTQLGEHLYNRIKEHPEAALNCTTKEEYNYYVQKTYDALAAYPQHIAYFRSFFDNPRSIAKYAIMQVRGSLCTISSANAEQVHSSNEVHVPTKMIGIVTPEKHVQKLVARNDEWVKRDLLEQQELQLSRASFSQSMVPGSMEHDALITLARHPYENLFSRAYSKMSMYRAEQVHDSTSGEQVLTGTNIIHVSDDSIPPVFIPNGGRCPRPQCVAYDYQCVHEMVQDQKFCVTKWSTRWWSVDVYSAKFGDHGNHLEEEAASNHPATISPSNSSSSSETSQDQVVNAVQDTSDGATTSSSQSASVTIPPRVRVKQQRRSVRVPYRTLTSSFQVLAEDVRKRDPAISRMLHGFIVGATNILSDLSAGDAKPALNDLMTQTTNEFAAHQVGFPTPTSTSVQDLSEAASAPTGSTNDTKLGPVIRPPGPGGVKTCRILSSGEQRKPIARAKVGNACNYCGLKAGHNINTCPDRVEMGRFVPEGQFAQFSLDIATRESTRFTTVAIPHTCTPFLQLPPKVEWLCLHNYASYPSSEGSGFVTSDREETHFFCVTCVFENAAVDNLYEKCYVRSKAVCDWVTQFKYRSKRVLIGKSI